MLVVSAGVYLYNMHVDRSRSEATDVATQEQTSVSTDAEAKSQGEDVSGRKSTSSKRQSRDAQPRVSGIEIPAYLTDRPEEIIQHVGHTISYNSKWGVPNWVAWELTPERTNGGERRADNFQPDERIRKDPVVTTYDYRGSGYDRGHMCPAADNKHNRRAMNECFLMTNICPQVHALNAGDWEELENKCRTWARKYGAIYIVAGPVIRKGETYERIGENGVMVPKQFFKVVMRLNADETADAIGFVYNNNDEQHPMAYYARSVDEVEALTGINFFSKLAKDVERKAEAVCDVSRWSGLR